jgi:hypothetical protein
MDRNTEVMIEKPIPDLSKKSEAIPTPLFPFKNDSKPTPPSEPRK